MNDDEMKLLPTPAEAQAAGGANAAAADTVVAAETDGETAESDSEAVEPAAGAQDDAVEAAVKAQDAASEAAVEVQDAASEAVEPDDEAQDEAAAESAEPDTDTPTETVAATSTETAEAAAEAADAAAADTVAAAQPDAEAAAETPVETPVETAGGTTAWPAFWLPAQLRERLIGADTAWREVTFAGGAQCGDTGAARTTTGEPGSDDASGAPVPTPALEAVQVRWPLLSHAEWAEVVSELRAARDKAPRGPEYWQRLQAAVVAAARRLADRADPYYAMLRESLPAYTGYAPGMTAATLGASDPWELEEMVAALRHRPDKTCGARWQGVPGLRGRSRFFPEHLFDKAAAWVPVAWEMPLYRAESRPETVLSVDAEGIPGTAFLRVLLALSATLRGEAPLPRPVPPPVVLVGNSLREPIFTPMMLSAIEAEDPELVSMVAVTVWDGADVLLEKQFVGEADIVMMDASVGGVTAVERGVQGGSRHQRAEALEPKVGFSVISREVLDIQAAIDDGLWNSPGETNFIDMVALMGALDSAWWDQNGCFASRVHFVEKGGPADDLPADYARRLAQRLRQVAGVMPRGAWPARRLHDPFDRYKAVEGTDRWGNGLQVISDYDDPFVVVLDERTGRVDPSVFASMVADCRTRVVFVLPVASKMDVPRYYLRTLPRGSVQSIGVAAGKPGERLSKSLLSFSTACGKRGVTAIRLLGGGALPRPAYSWDGLVPLDLVGCRPPGHFTTVEFERPIDELMESYRIHLARLAALPPVDRGGS